MRAAIVSAQKHKLLRRKTVSGEDEIPWREVDLKYFSPETATFPKNYTTEERIEDSLIPEGGCRVWDNFFAR